MRICDLQTGQTRILRAAKSLREEWRATTEHWKDSTRAAFEREHLQPLAPQVTLMLAAVQQLADVLAQVEKDCSDVDQSEL